MCVALPACKKAETPAADAAKADAAKADAAKADAAKADAAKTDAAKADAAKADAAKADAAKADDAVAGAANAAAKPANCTRWANNPLFADGNVMHFDFDVIHGAPTEGEDGGEPEDMHGKPGWECDANGDCTKKFKGAMDCTVKLVLNEANYCASELSCTANGEDAIYINGLWAADSTGIYYSNAGVKGVAPLTRKAESGCDVGDCDANTLRADFDGLVNEESFPLIPYAGNIEDSDGESLECTNSGTTWTCDGGVGESIKMVWDDQRGIVSYDLFAEGNGLGNLKVNLKLK